jgi:hypothetical protein
MLALALVVVVYTACAAGAAVGAAPGAVAFWHAASAGDAEGARRVTNTKTQDASSVSAYLSERLLGLETVVVLTASDGRGSLQHTGVLSAIERAGSSALLPAVYSSTNGGSGATTKAAILKTVGNGGVAVQKKSLGDFLKQVQQTDVAKNPLSNGKLDAFEIVLTGHESEQSAMKEVVAAVGAIGAGSSKTLFVAMQEPTSEAPAATAHYSRILASKSSNLVDGIYYKPEGAEYSIYYADTYLYLTPDIFTGLLSGFFFLFTILIGVSCMNQIQGPTSFSHKENVPAIGREA